MFEGCSRISRGVKSAEEADHGSFSEQDQGPRKDRVEGNPWTRLARSQSAQLAQIRPERMPATVRTTTVTQAVSRPR